MCTEFPHFVVCQQYMTAQIWDFDWVEPITKMQFAPLNNARYARLHIFPMLPMPLHYRFMHAACGMSCWWRLLLPTATRPTELHEGSTTCLWYAVPSYNMVILSRIFQFEWRRWQMSHIEVQHQLFIISYHTVADFAVVLCMLCQVSFDFILSTLCSRSLALANCIRM